MGKSKSKNRNNRPNQQQRKESAGQNKTPQTEYQEMFPSYGDQKTSRGGQNNAGHTIGNYRSDTQNHHSSQNSSSHGHMDPQNHYSSRNSSLYDHTQREYKPNDYQRGVDSVRQQEIGKREQKNSLENNSKAENRTKDVRDGGHYPQKENGQQSEKLMQGLGNSHGRPECEICKEDFDDMERLPRALSCGHTFCTLCLKNLLKKNHLCPKCRNKSFEKVKMVEDIAVNYALLEIIIEMKTDKSKLELEGATSLPHNSRNESDKQTGTSSSSKSTKSPHDSRCLEAGIKPAFHCVACLKWVCNQCGQIDHKECKGCYLIPKKEALEQMTKAQINGATATEESIENMMTELETYDKRLDIFSLTMQAAFESISKERERIRAIIEKGTKKNNDLKQVVRAVENNINMPMSLDWMQQIENHCNGAQRWISQNASQMMDHDRMNNITKEILFGTVSMKMMAGNVQIFAHHTIGGKTLLSLLTLEGRRILVKALEKVDKVAAGSRALPLNSTLSCLDPSSALTFLDVGWGGQVKGRVFIRLLGNTQRGQQFLMLCTGKNGPSFRHTGFHRIWWKNLPGEHIWGGDYDKRDGSGGKSLLDMSDKDISKLPPGKCLPIRDGLVAGRYEKTNISSIFRIYTKGCKPEPSSRYNMSRNPVEEKDEEAFGQVEFGLRIFEEAAQLRNINDVCILDCGIVIET